MPGPHDLLVRYTFSRPEQAAAELRAALSPDIVQEVDWSTLRRESDSVVDEELKETQSDLLFSASTHAGRPVLVYLLLEHQSKVEPEMAWRLLRYVARVVEHWRKQHPGRPFPVVVPLVLYHGKEGWTAPRRVEELFALPQGEERQRWARYVPHFGYEVDDLTRQRVETLVGRESPPLARLVLLVLRLGRVKKLAGQASALRELLARLDATPTGPQDLRTLLRYLFLTGEKAGRKALEDVLLSAVGSQRTEELMRTIGEELIEKGRREGRQEGRQEGLAEAVLRLLAARGWQVDEHTRQRVLACSNIRTLQRWFDRALTAASLSDVLA